MKRGESNKKEELEPYAHGENTQLKKKFTLSVRSSIRSSL